MPPRKQNSPQNIHTVVLQPRRSSASQRQNTGLEQGYSAIPRGSPNVHAPPVARGPTHFAPQPPPQDAFNQQNDFVGGGDLLVRFGIDSAPGRMVARILVWLIFFQPVYVAFGMELEDEPIPDPVEEVEEVEKAPVVEEEEELAEEPVQNEEPEEVDEEVPDVDADENESGDDEEVIDVEATSIEEENDVEATSNDQDAADDATEESTQEEEVMDETGSDDATEEETADEEEAIDEDGTQEEEAVVDEDETDTEEGDNQEEEDTGTGSSGGGGSSSSDEDESTDDETEETNEDEDTQEEGSEDSNEGSNGEGVTDESTEGEEGADDETTDEVSTEETPGIDETLVEETEGATYAQDLTNKYTFGEGDCTIVADGEFYCIASGPERQMTGDPRVYAEKDREGDQEIFYFDGIEVKRITNNAYDDFAPVFDEDNRRIVWQAMINDRLQVMYHEIPTNTTRQVTTSRTNSSNPDIEGDIVVWQEWVETNWEVMVTDIDNNGEPFEIEQLTDNAVHDMFPQVYDDLITWQKEKGSSWEVIVYDMRTGKQHALEKTEDTKFENPRFVLLFDSRHDNGDIETIGYDLDTGEMMELGTKSMPMPAQPLTPNEETPDALPREAASSSQVKVQQGREDDADPGDELL